MRRCLSVLGLAFVVAGCAQVLGIEERGFDPSAGALCANALDCASGSFCGADGRCGAAPPSDSDCSLLEPTESGDLAAFDWSGRPLLLGTLFRVHNQGELPRLQSMRLAVREINENGGVGTGRKIVMVVCDYGGESGNAPDAEADPLIEGGVDYLAAGLGARVIIAGSSSSVTQKAIDRILESGHDTAFISSFSTSTQLTSYPDKLAPEDEVGLLWRTAPDDDAQAEVLASLVEAHDTVTKLAIVYVDDTYGSPLQQGVKVALDALGSTKKTSVHPFDDQKKPDEAVQEALSQDPAPDGLLFIGVDGQQVVTAYQAIVKGGHDTTAMSFFLADAAKDAETLLDVDLPKEVKAIVARAKGTAPYHSTAPHYDTFAVNLKKAFGVEAENFSFVAQSYDAAYLAAYGLIWADAAGDLRGVAVATGFAHLIAGDAIAVGRTTWPTAFTKLTTGEPQGRTIDVDGTSGPLDFDVATGNAPGPIEIWRANPEGDAFETCAVCQAGEPCAPADCFKP